MFQTYLTANSTVLGLARGTHALSRAVERPRKRGSPRRNSSFSPSFRMLINSNEPGTLPQALGTLDLSFDNSLLAVGGGRPRPPLLGARQ